MPKLDDPVAVSIFGLGIRWYAIFILAGIICAILLIQWLARRRGMDANFPLDLAPWVVLAAIVGARLYYLLLKPGYYSDNADEALNMRLGGLTVHGAIAGGAIALYLFARHRGERFFSWGDLIVAGLALGQAIGRWGNWANQEAFGEPSDLPWAVTIDRPNRPVEFAEFSTFHPTFLYESISNLVIAAILVMVILRMPFNRFWREGDAIWIYLVLYGLVRLAIESMRTDSLYIGPLPAAYWVSAGLIGAGVVCFIVRRTLWPGAIVASLPEYDCAPEPVPAHSVESEQA